MSCRPTNPLTLLAFLFSLDSPAAGVDFRRGDSNADGAVDITDGITTLEYLFLGTSNIICLDAGDADDSGVVDITDGIGVLTFLFLGSDPPAAPGPDLCGPDPTADLLPCEEYPPCDQQPPDLTRLIETSPAHGEGGVAVTRETILRFSAALKSPAIAAGAVFASFAGEPLPWVVHVSSDRRTVSLFYKAPLPASASVRVTIDGDQLLDERDRAVDADGDGAPGGRAVIDFDTLGLTLVPGTAVCGRVFASEPTAAPGGDLNVPLEGVQITVDGISSSELIAVTDALGDFRLEPAPSGRFFVHIRGYTAHNVPPGGSYYPAVGKAWESVPGEESKVGDIYLPLIRPGTLTEVNAGSDTRICFPESVLAGLPEHFRDVCITVPAGALFLDPNFNGEVPRGMVGIAPVDPDRLPSPLPDGLRFPLVITVQTDGAENFDRPAPICFPNLPDPETGALLGPGAKTALWSFNHDLGDWEIAGSMTVSADGLIVCTDPGVGIRSPGWHSTNSSVGATGGGIIKEPEKPKKKCPEPTTPREPKKDDCNSNAACAHGCKVYLHNGEEHFERVDLVIPGRAGLDFVMRRSYRSQVDFNGPMGFGWDFDYNESLFPEDSGEVGRSSGRGHVDSWSPSAGGGFDAPAGDFRALVQEPDGSYVLRAADGFKRLYHPDGRLQAHVDRWGNSIQFEYDRAGNLDLVIDTFGREIDFVFQTFPDGVDRLAAVRDFTGREVAYSYDGQGNLASARSPAITGTSTGNDFPQGRTERYTYTSGFAQPELNHNLLSVTRPEEAAGGGPPELEWVYGTAGADFDRVLEERLGGGRANASGVAAGGATRYRVESLNAGAPPGQFDLPRGRVTVTERNGNMFEYYANERRHHILTRRLTRGLRPGEPAAYETRSFFDADGQMLRQVHPEGNEVRYRYDSSGARGAQQNLVEVRRIPGPRGGDGAGAPVDDIATTYAYEPLNNRVRSETGPRGNAAGFTPPLGQASAERYTTRYFFDYQEGAGPIPDALRFGIDLGDIERGLGDLNGDGRTDQTAGNIVRTEMPAVELRAESREAARRGAARQEIVEEAIWNDRGQLLKSIDAEGNVLALEYYPETDPDGDGVAPLHPWKFLSATDGAGYLKSVTRDAETSPRRTAADPPARLRTTYRHDPLGRTIERQNPRGIVTAVEYNALDEAIVTTRGAAIAGEAISDGQLITGEAPLAYRSSRFYDRNGRILREETENRDGPPGSPDPAGLGATIESTSVYDLLGNVVQREMEAAAGKILRWTYRYDGEENLVRVTAPEGTAVAVEYDERNLPFRLTRGAGSPEASTTTTDYDLNGKVRRSTDAADNDGDGSPESTLFIHDGFDRLVEARDALGNRSISSFDPDSNRIRARVLGHPAGRPGDPPVLLLDERFHHDEHNRVFRVDQALFLAPGPAPQRQPDLRDGDGDGTVTTFFEFDALGRRTFTEEDDGEAHEVVYDGAGRPVETLDAAGNRLRRAYDRNSNVVRVTSTEVSPDGLVAEERFTSHQVFDQLDRLVRATDNAGQTSRFAFDSRDNLVHRSDPEGPPAADPLGLFPAAGQNGPINAAGNTESYHLDGLGRLIQVISDLRIGGAGGNPLDASNPANPDGRIALKYEWNGNSNLAAMVDDAGNRTSFGYDALDRKTLHRFADDSVHRFVHDRDDNLVEILDARGVRILRAHDALNRLVRVDVDRAAVPAVAGTNLEIYEYDGLSRLTRSTDDNGAAEAAQTCEYIYDSLSRIIEERQNGLAVSNVFSGDGKRVACTYPGGRRIEYAFDSIDRPEEAREGAAAISEFSWIGGGLRELVRRNANGTSLTFLDAAGATASGYDAAKRTIRQRWLGPGGSAMVDRQHGYNRAGVRTFERRSAPGEGGGLSDGYTYDSLYRITSTSLALGDIAQLDYQLDGAGNRRAVRTTDRDGSASTCVYAPNNLNQYAGVCGQLQAHDRSGNLTGDGLRVYAYDHKNRLAEARDAASGRPIARYLYLADNRRSRKEVYSNTQPGVVARATDFLWDGTRTVEERNASTQAVEATYVHGPTYADDHVQMARTGDHPLGAGTFYLHQNARYDVVAVTDAAGNVVERTAYDDFGNPSAASASGNPFLFQGQPFDAETGLYYFRNRYYDPRTGRFLQRDPEWDAGNLGNSYSLVRNSPVSAGDPEGTKPRTQAAPCEDLPSLLRGADAALAAAERALEGALEKATCGRAKIADALEGVRRSRWSLRGRTPTTAPWRKREAGEPVSTASPGFPVISPDAPCRCQPGCTLTQAGRRKLQQDLGYEPAHGPGEESKLMDAAQERAEEASDTMKCTQDAEVMHSYLDSLHLEHWEFTRWRWGGKVFDSPHYEPGAHSAVVVYPKGTPPEGPQSQVRDLWWGRPAQWRKSCRPGGYPYDATGY